jgi:chaperonin GroES
MHQQDQESSGNLSLRPLGARVLVEQKPFQERLDSGLYIPQGAREGYEDTAIVRAIGPGVTADLKVGDRVIFQRQPSSALLPDARELDANGWKNLLMLKEENILAVVED